MKSIKFAAFLIATIFFMIIFVNVSLGFDPQPEPPGVSAINQAVHPPEKNSLQQSMGQQSSEGSEKMEEEEEILLRNPQQNLQQQKIKTKIPAANQNIR